MVRYKIYHRTSYQMIEIIEQDERDGAPSASSAGRILLCLGSFELERRVQDKGGIAAKRRGTKIHDFLMGTVSFDKLGKSQKICAERCMYEEGRIIENLNMEGGAQIREKRLKLIREGRTIFSGQSDVTHFYEHTALIVNYKSGFYPVTPIKENWQMISEAILTAYHFNEIKKIYTCLIHPNAPLVDGSISQVESYDSEELLFNPNFMLKLSKACYDALQANAPRTPGHKQCEWCHGKKQECCPEYLSSKVDY